MQRRFMSTVARRKEDVLKQVEEALRSGKVSSYQLEAFLGDKNLAVDARRAHIASRVGKPEVLSPQGPVATPQQPVAHLPSKGEHFDERTYYDRIYGANCEMVIGYVPVPVGVVGPLKVDDTDYHVPLATTEGALLASVNRGARAIRMSREGGARSAILRDGMTRSPVLRLPSATRAAEFARWVEHPDQKPVLEKMFSSTTRFGKLQSVRATVAGRSVYLRFACSTGDAMGMNMVGKGVNEIVRQLCEKIPGLELVALSGNYCTDKKPSAANWILGRGKSVVCEATLPAEVVEKVLKTTVKDLAALNVSKNLVGSAVAGSVGGNNAHAANVVTAAFIACGQDPAQNVESSNCMTLLESIEDGKFLHCSVTMPSLEVGTVGGGTTLPAQAACLEMLGVRGAHPTSPGQNAEKLARIIAATVLAGELSLNAALASNHLISAHLDLNRKKT